jgi:prevent-host-death family protein
LDVDLAAAFVERRVTTSGTTSDEAEMAEIGVKELKATASAVIDRVEDGAAFVVTRRGRPAAVLMPVDEAEDLVLANADEYVRMRRAARAAYAAGGTVDLAELA